MKLILLMGLLSFSLGDAAWCGSVEPKFVLCKSKKVVRSIQIEPTADGCRTIYSKAGVERVVGQGKNPLSCDQVMKNIRKNLEGADWKCKEVPALTSSEMN